MCREDVFLNQLKDGQPAAYEVLVDQFEGPLYRFFLCDHYDHHMAQDETAETFAQLVRSLPKMRGSHEQLRTYVFAVARHVQQRHWRRHKRRNLQLTDAQHVSDTRPSPLIQAANRERVEQVLDAIGCLDTTVRSVLLLRFVEGLSIEEVAEALEMPTGTVKSHIHRGRSQLRVYPEMIRRFF